MCPPDRQVNTCGIIMKNIGMNIDEKKAFYTLFFHNIILPIFHVSFSGDTRQFIRTGY